jgi:hypothetical protein
MFTHFGINPLKETTIPINLPKNNTNQISKVDILGPSTYQGSIFQHK